jgi:hypothetical protein
MQNPVRISRGAGMTAGLELWSARVSAKGGDKFVLVDRSVDGRFATDVTAWNAAAGLNAAAAKKVKDAAKQDTA